jgi:hypothetical protein
MFVTTWLKLYEVSLNKAVDALVVTLCSCSTDRSRLTIGAVRPMVCGGKMAMGPHNDMRGIMSKEGEYLAYQAAP